MLNLPNSFGFLIFLTIPWVISSEKVINPHNFKYILNPEHELCNTTGNEDVFLFIYVHSAPSHFKKRQALRDTWLRRSMFPQIRVGFMMGKPNENHIQESLRLEFGLYRDIVQENFVDTYRNLTYKGIMAMKWISEYCTQPTYILKIDDDIIANPFLLLKHLDHMRRYEIEKQRTVMCLVWTKMKVVRNSRSKWFISKEEYQPDFFNRYCSGSAYIFTRDLPPLLYQHSFNVKFFWVDDYYITGLLTAAANATLEFYNSVYALSASRFTPGFAGRRADTTLFGHLSKTAPKTIYLHWKLILERTLANAHLRNHTRYSRFKFIDDFTWSMSFWDDYFTFNEDYFY